MYLLNQSVDSQKSSGTDTLDTCYRISLCSFLPGAYSMTLSSKDIQRQMRRICPSNANTSGLNSCSRNMELSVVGVFERVILKDFRLFCKEI